MKSLYIYNTLTRTKEEFIPIERNKVRMYSCGVTVYDYCHLGHARSYITWDVVKRYLEYIGYEVTHIQNFTDVDDKIIQRARFESVEPHVITSKYINAYFEDMSALNVKQASSYPCVTNHIEQIITFIQGLESKGFTYCVNSNVYLSIERVPTYGKLSHREQEELQAGSGGRALNTTNKQHTSDFVLWKGAKLGEISWDSPWGKGRPGWHIECSAMIKETLGNTIDIHTGGNDLIFPHHENEIAQSESLTSFPLANYWMHNGMVNINNTKMSKSLNNFTTIREVINTGISSMAIRLLVLQSHYRKPLSFTSLSLESATNSWNTLREALLFDSKHKDLFNSVIESNNLGVDSIEDFHNAMCDDFNTPLALSTLFDLAKRLNTVSNTLSYSNELSIPIEEVHTAYSTLKELTSVLGLEVLEEEVREAPLLISDEGIETLIQDRYKAKTNKDYKEADGIRAYLKSLDITLVDLPNGTTKWIRE